MNAIGIYVAYTEKTKSELEKEMKYIAERNAELERIIRSAEEAKDELKKNRERMTELAVQYSSMEGDM